MALDGVIAVDKPPGWTSHDVVARCRRLLGERRVGHGGTLDPDATGLLLVGVGRVTRLLRFVSALPKTYEGEMMLGTATTTLDTSGEVTGTWDMSRVTPEQVSEAARGLTGMILQVPPMVSAVHVGGRRLHELAREGRTVERTGRTVNVERFVVEPRPGAGQPRYRFEVTCSAGAYVRSLVDDLGRALGGGAHLGQLRRVSIGPFGVSDAVPLEAVEPGALRPPAEAVGFLERVVLEGPGLVAVRHGRKLARDDLSVSGTGPWAVLDPTGTLVAVYESVDPEDPQLRALVVVDPA